MLEIKNNLELKTNSDTKQLLFATRYLVQINFTFDLTVKSGDFSGRSYFCVRTDQLRELAEELSKMVDKLEGETKLEDNDSDASVAFKIESNGHLVVSGQVGGTHDDHYMKFEFQTDQTSIPEFISEINQLLNYKDDMVS